MYLTYLLLNFDNQNIAIYYIPNFLNVNDPHETSL